MDLLKKAEQFRDCEQSFAKRISEFESIFESFQDRKNNFGQSKGEHMKEWL
jgi:hypothetical protein